MIGDEARDGQLVFVFELPDNVEPTEAQFKGTGRGRLGVNVRLERRAS